MKHKVDLDKLRNDLRTGNLQPWMCEIPGCREPVIWMDKPEEWVSFGNKKVNIGDGMGLVYNTCEKCKRKICMASKARPSKNNLQGLPEVFYPHEEQSASLLLSPTAKAANATKYRLENYNKEATKSNQPLPEHLRHIQRPQNKQIKGHVSALPGPFKNTPHCGVERFWVDHMDKIKLICCCHQCKDEYWEDLTEEKKKHRKEE